jgi:hypothetical protein
MGLLDGIRELLGVRAEADAASDAAPDDLFGMSTAHVTMGGDLGYDAADQAALCFSGVDSTDFEDTVDEVIALLEASREEFGTEAEFHEDSHGYRWVVLEDDVFEDLVNNVHFVARTFIDRDYGNRLLAAVFGFEKDDQPAYWIYSFRRGSFYPFVPSTNAARQREQAVEFKLESVLDGELDVEDDKEFWYPLWPSDPGRHPWA